MTCGWVVHTLQASKGWSAVRAYRAIFFAYAVIGLIKFLLACSLSRNCEAERKVTPATDAETAPLLGDNRPKAKESKPSRSLLPSISKESRIIVLNLCILFALDSFASGLAPLYVFANSCKRQGQSLTLSSDPGSRISSRANSTFKRES
jgi:hypothetical protein